MAATLVGSLPELVQAILSHLEDDQGALASAMRVNSMWFKVACDILWRAVDVRRLCNVAAPRRQVYTASLAIAEFLWLKASDTCGDLRVLRLLSKYKFPSLRNLAVGCSLDSWPSQLASELQDTIDLSNFCHSPLRTFKYHGGIKLTPAIFSHIGQSCHMLESIVLKELNTVDIDSNLMLLFLTSLPSIQKIVFGQGVVHVLDQHVITHIARRIKLRKLHWEVELNTSILGAILSTTDHDDIFPSMRNLRTYIDKQSGISNTRTVKQLLQLLRSLSRLYLLNKNEDGIEWEFQWISHMKNLVHLSLDFDRQSNVTGEDLRSLGSILRLRKLQIGSTTSLHPTATGFSLTPEDFEFVFARLKNLEKFFCNVDVTPATANGIVVALSHHCRDIQHVRAQQFVIDFEACRFRDRIWFPSLQVLEVGGFMTNIGPNQFVMRLVGSDLGRALRRTCPELLLAVFFLNRTGLYSETAIDTFRRLRVWHPDL